MSNKLAQGFFNHEENKSNNEKTSVKLKSLKLAFKLQFYQEQSKYPAF
jgi:hypothetical protein